MDLSSSKLVDDPLSICGHKVKVTIGGFGGVGGGEVGAGFTLVFICFNFWNTALIRLILVRVFFFGI